MKQSVLFFFGLVLMVALGARVVRAWQYDERELRALRSALPRAMVAPTQAGAFETVPDPDGVFVYEATALRPLVDGASLVLSTNQALGLVTAGLRGVRGVESHFFKDKEGAYWKLGDAFPEGDYGVGLMRVASNSHPALYLNGRIVQLETETEGLNVGPFVVNECRTGRTIRLRPGDELAVMARYGWRAIRLILYPHVPEPGRHYAMPHYDPYLGGPDLALAVTGHLLFYGADGKLLPSLRQRDGGRNQVAAGPAALETAEDGRPVVRCELFNPLPTPVEVDYQVTLRSFYRLPVGGAEGRVRLEPHASWRQAIPFDVLPDERAFSAELTLSVVEPRDESSWRQDMHWPALSWIEFLPGVRQGVAWPKTFEDYDLRRLEFSDPVDAVRRQILLDGGSDVWQVAYSPNWQAVWPTEEHLEWEDGSVPVSWLETSRKAEARTPRANALYLRRTFALPEDTEAQSCIMIVESAAHELAMYVNGTEAGRVRGGNAPLWVDITALARPGENELVLVSRNALAIMNPAYINPENPVPNKDYFDAPGHWNIWALSVGNVSLHLSPRISGRSLQVISSTRQQTLEARFEVVNNSQVPRTLQVVARVLDEGHSVLDLGETVIEVEARGSAPVAFAQPWEDARWWWPFDPHLYVMQVETVDAETGERLDLLRERFGFRESWVDGPRMMLNDMAIRPRGAALGYREEPNHFARGVDGSAGPDWTDERGMMGGTYITQLSNTSSRHNVERDSFWAASETNALLAIRQRWNNPSVARWLMSNEWLQYVNYPDPQVVARRFKRLSDAVREADPTRWTSFGGEGDLHGLLDHFNFHYMKPYFGGQRMRGVNPYAPDGYFWRELHAELPPGAAVPLNSHEPNVILRPDEKMFFEHETLWKVGDLMPPSTTAFAGENAVLWSAWDSASGPALWMWKQTVDGVRDFGASLINHFTRYGVRGRVLLPQVFLVPEIQHHAFGGRMIERRYAVLQDLFRTCDMTFRWTLIGPDGQRHDGGEDRQTMPSGTTHRGVLSVTLPEVESRTEFVLALELESDGVLVMAEERDIAVWPDAPVQAGPLARKVVLFEPGVGRALRARPGARTAHTLPVSDTAEALTAAGVAFARMADLSDPSDQTDPSNTLVIIAEDALNEQNRRSVAALNAFVEAGGRLLVLRQTVTPGGLPADTTLEVGHWASQVYIRAGNHPIVAGWSDWDFHFWADDRSVTHGGYVKPSGGPATVILDSGERTRSAGIEWAGLMEQYRGQGLILLCQLPVIAKHDQEPMAREVLARMLSYMAGLPAFRSPTEQLKVMTETESPMVERLQTVAASLEIIAHDAELTGACRVLIDAASVREIAPVHAARWAEAIRAGAVVTVAGAIPDDADWLGILAHRPVRLAVHPHGAWDGRGMRSAWTPITAGLSQVDLYWKRFDSHQSATQQAEQTRYVIEVFQQYAAMVEGDGVVESIWPGALLEISVGSGMLMLDQRNLYTRHSGLNTAADRNVSALMLGLGVAMAPVVETPEMPAGVGYKPVDLTDWANRAFVDEIPEDGKGGWSDQGSSADLREFPDHNRRIGGIPFVFSEGENKCIVLTNPRRPFAELLPREVVIPLGFPLKGLYFLHGSAFSGRRPIAFYEIQYDDGSSETIVFHPGMNLGDWVGARAELPRERGTRSVLAWTGSTPRFRQVGIYRMEWVNPHPERLVTALRFHKPEGMGGTPILMALTAAVAAGEGDGVDPETRLRAQEMAREAAALLAVDDAEKAGTLAREALRLDDGCEEAYAVLGDLANRSGVLEERLAIFQEWIDSGATQARPFNELGELLEQRGNLRGALEAYRRSLQIEWNQPPIIGRRSSLEERVK